MMAIEIQKGKEGGTVEQRIVYESGNEMAAYAAHQINYHIMGYFPISPSTEVASFSILMKANGQHDIKAEYRQTASTARQVSATGSQWQGDVCSMRRARTDICTC